MKKTLWIWIAVLALGVPPPAPAAEPLDPVAQEVVRMLDARISETVVVEWLDSSGKRPAALSSQDLIELKRAGASDELMRRLLELAGGKTLEPAAPRPAPVPAPTPAPAGRGDLVRMRFNFQYQPAYVEDERPWDLFLYLDGSLLARIEPGVVAVIGKPLQFEGNLPPGRHVVRLVQERHRRVRSGWHHEARVSPEVLEFTLAPGEEGQMDLRLREVRLALNRQPPLELTVRQGERTLVETGPAGTEPASWPPLCEEIEVNLEPGKRPALPIRRELERCVRWASLWSGIAGAPTRDTVRAELARYDYVPALARK